MIKHYLYLNEIEVQSANAISSPLTYGFPSITAFTGMVHALSRKIPSEMGIHLGGVLVACHDCQVKIYRPHNGVDYTFVQSRYPLRKSGEAPSINEEGKVDMKVSLIIEVQAANTSDIQRWLDDNETEFTTMIYNQVMKQRLAGGSIRSIHDITLLNLHKVSEDEVKVRLLPAFVLMEAKNDFKQITDELKQVNPEKTALDALIEIATLHHIPENDDSKKETHWRVKSVKQGRGWLVPISIGYQGISEKFQPHQLQHCRWPTYQSQYVECLYSLGKWVFPYRIQELSSAFWHYDHSHDNIYLVSQSN